MKRDRIDFATFKANFIDHPDGYFSVYSNLEEDYEGNRVRLLLLDMICEWRLDDGCIKFVEVPFDTEEEFKQLIAYLRVTAGLLNAAILERIGELSYTESRPESEAVPFPPSSLPKLSDEKLEQIRKQVVSYELSLLADALREQRGE
jgi:hypothetical protein